MENPYDTEVLMEKALKIEAIVEYFLKDVKGVIGASEYQALEAAMEEGIHIEAIIGVEALDVVETITTCISYDPILDNVLNSSIHQPETKIPTNHNSPTQSSEHIPSIENDMVLPLGPIMPSPKPTDDLDSYIIA